MIKSILLPIHKKHNENIESGAKLLELRKSIPKDLKEIIKNHGGIWVYDYETLSSGGRGKITNRWWFDEYDTYYFNEYQNDYRLINKNKELLRNAVMDYDKLCLTEKQVNEYGNGNVYLYNWHIKKLEVFDKPMELSEFYTKHKHDHLVHYYKLIERPPQSWQYVYVKE